METKQKTLAECKDEVAKQYSYMGNPYKSWEAMQNTMLYDVPESSKRSALKDLIIRFDEAAELYAGQTKQLEKTHGDENPAEFMRGKINEYFHDWRKSETDSPIIEIDGNTLSEITFKAELETKKKFPWIRYKQSHPVSEITFKAFEDFWNFAYSENDLTTSDPEFDTIDHETCRKIFEAGFLANKSQQPASIAWLSDYQIKELVAEFEIEGQKAFRAFKNFQSELRKRVIDPVEFVKLCIKSSNGITLSDEYIQNQLNSITSFKLTQQQEINAEIQKQNEELVEACNFFINVDRSNGTEFHLARIKAIKAIQNTPHKN